MKVTQLAVLGVAIASAGGAYWTANNLASTPPEAQAIEEVKPTIELSQVLVARSDIPLGTSLKEDMVEWQSWPTAAVVDGYLVQESNPKGLNLDEEPAIARSTFAAGEPIRSGKLVRGKNGYMSAILPAGKVAVATEINTASSAGGFILPNDRVDVLMTREGTEEDGSPFLTDTVLTNVRVLAIDQTIEEKDGEAVVVGETATLQLSPKEARILTVSKQMAVSLSLVLRSLEDSTGESQQSADYLLTGERGNGRVRIIKYGNRKEVLTGTNSK